jgi:hypothetical protein
MAQPSAWLQHKEMREDLDILGTPVAHFYRPSDDLNDDIMFKSAWDHKQSKKF